ncbi:uncharacterized protein FTJAE_2947 [Fusarium tjaetaba]|uniref:Uncharacterized protein n=1 Tax=Fusarium tjaetaba TaxID=1567544 RepID=A0A8H5W3F0_9HYPO|nr:uncharacterized protein FTJAE_2947 [Fusarium tjaetaba]KAF5643878.1 hypothetical protein FTJAE_2947 [Fusarium tjaetaba]
MSCALRLPTIRVIANQANVELSASASINIDAPYGAPHFATIRDLSSAVEDSHLWIARSVACCLEVSIALNGYPILETESLDTIAQAVRGCEVWDCLGVHLGPNRTYPVQQPGLLSFSLQHPDLSSALVAPVSAYTTAFRKLMLSIDVRNVSQEEEHPRKCLKTSKRWKKRVKHKKRVGGRIESNLLGTLDLVDQQAIDNFMFSLNSPCEEGSRNTSQTLSREDAINDLKALKGLQSTSLIEILFEQLMLAPERSYRGYQVWGCGLCYCLTKLAPGVFHMPYLKSILDRAELLPIIATSLASMQHAESPVLRQQVTDLASGYEAYSHPQSGKDDSTDTLERKAWEVLLRHVNVPPSTNRRTMERIMFPTRNSRISGPGFVVPGLQPPMESADRKEPESGESVHQKSQSIPTMHVSWDIMDGYLDITNGKEHHEAITDLSLEVLGIDRDLWSNATNSPTSIGWPEPWLGEAGQLGTGFDTMEFMNEMPLEQAWMRQDIDFARRETRVDPANFPSLDHWLSQISQCNLD